MNPSPHKTEEISHIPETPDVREMLRLERWEWKLWSLAILAILWLTLGLLITPLAQWLGVGRLPDFGETGTLIYHLGLAVLVLSLCFYLLRSYRALRRMRARILADRWALDGMALDLEGVRSLLKVTASINAQVELPALLRMIVEEAVKTLGAHQSSLMLLDRSRTVLRTVATHGVHLDEIRHAELRLGEGVAGWVAQYGKPRLLQGRLEGEGFRGFEPKDRAIQSAVSVPLQVKGRVLGVLNVNNLEGGRQFQDNELRLIMLYANHAAVAIRNAALFKESQERAKLRAILEGYVSPVVARALMKDPNGWMNVGEMRELTVLFADIRGFTKAVHQMGPQPTRAFLNHFFTRMTEIIFQEHGTLDKFIGDSVMAFFGAPLPVKEPGDRAVAAAKAMIQAFAEMRVRWAERHPGLAALSLGVGISTGDLFVGNVGSRKRFDYTVIGQEANVASRLCDMARGGQILLSAATRRILSPRVSVRHMGDVHFEGMEGALHVFEWVPGPASRGEPPASG